MPVDLSRIGLEGIESAANVAATRQNIASAQVADEAKMFELGQAQRKQQLYDDAAAGLRKAALGKREGGSASMEVEMGQDDSGSGPLKYVARMAMLGGLTETAGDLYKNASEIDKRESDMARDEISSQQTKLENVLKITDIVGRRIGKAKNQSEWEFGVTELEKQGAPPELVEFLKSQSYDPTVAAYFADQAIAVADQVKFDMQSQTEGRIERQAAMTLDQTAQKISLQAARDAETTRHNQVMEKAGGKSASIVAPNSDALKSAKALLQADVFADVESVDDVALDAATNYIASQAQALVRDNRGIDWNTAVQRAIFQAKQSGALESFTTTETFLGIPGSSTKGARVKLTEGRTPESALTIPSGATAADMKRGRYYITPKGLVQWNGSRGILVERPVE